MNHSHAEDAAQLKDMSQEILTGGLDLILSEMEPIYSNRAMK